MDYEGPKHLRLRLRLRRIAKSYGLKLWFKQSLGFSGEYHVGSDLAIVQYDDPADKVISTFFHELGHHLDYHNGLFKTFYDNYAPLYKMRPTALKAERHADEVGRKLCKKYFPKIKYEKSYRTEDDIRYLREYYADGRKTIV